MKRSFGFGVALVAALALTGCASNVATSEKGRETISILQKSCDDREGHFSFDWVAGGYNFSCYVKEAEYVD